MLLVWRQQTLGGLEDGFPCLPGALGLAVVAATDSVPLNAACDKAAAEAVAVEWAQGSAELCSCITAGGQHGSIPGSTLGFSLAYSSSPVGFCLEQ